MELFQATEQHLDCLVALNIEVQNLHINSEPTIFKTPDREAIKAFFRDALRDTERKIFICFDKQQPLGYILLHKGGHEGHAFCYAQQWLYIDHIGVTKKFRGKGVGKKLIAAAKDYARELNINRILLDVWSFNVEAKAFFRKQGFTTVIERMRLEL